MRTEAEADRAVAQYADTVRRVCFMHLKNYHDVEDVFQEVFLKYCLYEGSFDSDAHEKAWLIRVTVNACRDVLKSFLRRRVLSLEDVATEPAAPPFFIAEENRDVLDALLALPEKYRDVLYLFYCEGYAATEIAQILGRKENTVYTWLSRARAKLRDALGDDGLDE